MARTSLRTAGLPAELVRTARARMGMEHDVFYAPSIPQAKENAARRVHAQHLPESEPILVLHDATLFGGAEDGFVITAERVCWKNLLEHPRQIEWTEIDPASVAPGDAGVLVAGGQIHVPSPMRPGLAGFLVEAISRCRFGDDGPYRGAAVASPETGGGTVAVARLASLARRHLGEVDDVYYHPSIPEAKLANARRTHALHLPEDEPIVVLYDDTLFGGADDGFVLTPERLCWKNLVDAPAMLAWEEIEPEDVRHAGNLVHVMGSGIQLSTRQELTGPAAALFAALAREARVDAPAT
jgi:hypothetical protein